MAGQQKLYFGTYTHQHGESRDEGIYQYAFDGATGTLELKRAEATLANPSFLAFTPDRRFMYAVNEVDDFEGRSGGGISAYAVDPVDGALTFLNAKSTGGDHPCYVSVDPSGRWVLVANYTGGSIAVYPIDREGRLGEATSFVQHEGRSDGGDPARQEGPHAHSILLDPTGKYALVADLGKDMVLVYHFNSTGGTLALNAPHGLHLAPGAGPRHIGFHPNGRYFYVVNELACTVTACTWNAELGTLTEIETVAALENPVTVENAADLHISANGKFLYTSNRGYASGNDSISVFAIDQESGKLTRIEIVPSGGKTPRNFAIDPSGAYLLVENQDSSNVVTFKIDGATGKLTATGHVTNVPMPVCAVFV